MSLHQSCRHIHIGIDGIVLDVQEDLVVSSSSKRELELVVQGVHVVLLQVDLSRDDIQKC